MADTPLIFLSYARRNAQLTETIATWLRSRGLRPWLDLQMLVAGQHWADELDQTIQACTLFILVLTPAALRSSYVRREYLYAQSLNKPIILLRMPHIRKLPTELQNMTVIDFTHGRDRGLNELIVKLLSIHILGTLPGSFDFLGTIALTALGYPLPAGWTKFIVPRHIYISLVFGYSLLLLITILVNGFFLYWFKPSLHFTLPNLALGLITLVSGGIAILWAVMIVTFGRFALGWWLPEVLIIAPTGIAWSSLSLSATFVTKRSWGTNFAALTQLSSQQTFTGNCFIELIGRDNKPIHFAIPRRLGNRTLIVAAIKTAYADFVQKNPKTKPTQPDKTPDAKPAASETVPIPLSLVLNYARQDLRFVHRLARELLQRGYALRLEQWSHQTTLNASASSIQVLSPAALRLQNIHLTLTMPHTISVVARPLKHPPAELAQLQWIDFTQNGDWQRHLYDLLFSLSDAEVAATSASPELWAELALSRDMRGQLPVNWHSFHMESIRYPLMQRAAIQLAIILSAPLLLLFPIAIGGMIDILFQHPALFQHTTLNNLFIEFLLLMITLLLSISLLLAVVNRLRKAHLYHQLYMRLIPPERIISTPIGFIVRRNIGVRCVNQQFLYHELTDVHEHSFSRNPTLLQRTNHNLALEIQYRATGQCKIIAIPSHMSNGTQAVSAIVAAWSQFQSV